MVVVKLENFWVSCTENCLSGKDLDETVLNGFANSTLDIRNCRGKNRMERLLFLTMSIVYLPKFFI